MINYLKICDHKNGFSHWFYIFACLTIVGLIFPDCIHSAPVLSELQDTSLIPVDVNRERRDAPASIQAAGQLIPGLPLPIDLSTIQKILQIITSLGQQIFNPTRMLSAALTTNVNDDYGGSDGVKYTVPFPLNRLSQIFNPSSMYSNNQ